MIATVSCRRRALEPDAMNLGPTLVLLLGLGPGQAQLPAPTEAPAPLTLATPAPLAGPAAAPPLAPVAAPPTNCQFTAEYLYWWSKTLSTPPLITTSNEADAGVLGAPSTQVLAGGNGVELDALQGFRAQWRYFHSDLLGLDAGGFYLVNGGRYNTYTRQTLAIPYVNPATGAQASLVLANVNGPYGYAAIQAFSQLWGVEAHGMLRVSADPEQPFEVLLGGRYLMLTEDLRLWTYTQTGAPSSSTSSIPGVTTSSSSTGTSYTGLDQFEARNHFAGGQAGVRYRRRWDRCDVEGGLTVAVGVTRQEMNINGNTGLGAPPTRSYLGDVFTQTSNLGRYNRDVFTVLPQARLAVGFRVFELVRVTAAADVLYWGGVVRPAGQIDTAVYPSAIPAATNLNPVPGGQPLARYGASDYWAAGLSLGAEIAF
jgi:hypothetical protein